MLPDRDGLTWRQVPPLSRATIKSMPQMVATAGEGDLGAVPKYSHQHVRWLEQDLACDRLSISCFSFT